MSETLHPMLLWGGGVLLYAAWLNRGDPSSRLSAIAGWTLSVTGGVLALATASGWGAGLATAVAHLTAAVTLVAVLVPLLSRPTLTMTAVVAVGGVLGLLEAVS